MNRQLMYSVYDRKGVRYDTPFFCLSDVFARRHFIMMVRKQGSMLNTFKNEFELYQIGSFDVTFGKLEVLAEKILVLEGKQIEMQEDN